MIAIIPARGGSKGLPGKNIRPLNGKPMIAYTIEAAVASSCVDRVIVSTDCPKIAQVAEEFGAEVPFLRPEKLAQDDSIAIDVYQYTIERLECEWKKSISEFVVLLPTCPLRTANDIDQAYELFNSQKASSVISYTEEAHPITWHKYLSKDNRFEAIFEERLANRQDERPSYYPNGAIFIFTSTIIKQGKYYDSDSFAYIMPRERSVDVDTLADFRYLEYLMRE